MRLLTRKEAMREAGLSWQGIRRAMRSGRLPYYLRGGRRMYRPQDLLAERGVTLCLCGAPLPGGVHTLTCQESS